VQEGCGAVFRQCPTWGCVRIRDWDKNRQRHVRAATRREVMLYWSPGTCSRLPTAFSWGRPMQVWRSNRLLPQWGRSAGRPSRGPADQSCDSTKAVVDDVQTIAGTGSWRVGTVGSERLADLAGEGRDGSGICITLRQAQRDAQTPNYHLDAGGLAMLG
jgi:hypothetical protein